MFPGTALQQQDLAVLNALAASLDGQAANPTAAGSDMPAGASRGQLNQESTAPVDLLLQFIECGEIHFVGL